MVVTDAEIERLARATIAKHGSRAARVATERLNEMIDRNGTEPSEGWENRRVSLAGFIRL